MDNIKKSSDYANELPGSIKGGGGIFERPRDVVPVELCSMCILIMENITVKSGFGCLEVACWPLGPKFAGSNPAEAVVLFGRKNPQHTFLRRGSKAACPMSCFTACKRTQK
jgi:hypothetical protein